MTAAAIPRRESGIPWVATLPEHWAVQPFFSAFEESKTRNAGLAESNLLSLSYGRIVRKDIESANGLLPESFETYQIVQPDTIIFRFTDLQNDQRSLRTARTVERGIITSAYGAARPRLLEPRYADYLMRSYDTTKVFYGLGGGVRQSLKLADIARMPVIVPPRAEQRAIAEYLDRETAQIDTLIAKQEQLIATLRERRAAIVAKLALRGVYDDCPVHVDASLGEVPSHWSIRTVRRWFENLDGARIPVSSEERGGMQGEFDYYGASGVIDHIDRYLFDEDLLLVSEDGANLLLRNSPIAFAAKGRYWVNNHAHVLRPRCGLVDYWAARLEAVDVTPLVTGSAQPKLTAGALGALRISAPHTLDEQEQIVDSIRSRANEIDTLIAKAEQFIALARERRSALITAAVTGQIDVRVAA